MTTQINIRKILKHPFTYISLGCLILGFLIGYFYPIETTDTKTITKANKVVLDANNEELEQVREERDDLIEIVKMKDAEIVDLQSVLNKRTIQRDKAVKEVINLNQREAQRWNDSVGRILVEKQKIK